MSPASRIAVAALAAGLAWTATGAATLGASPVAAAGSVAHAPTTPIHHFVVLMEENHTFDNYFGTYPGADGIPKGVCMPVDPRVGPTPCVRPFNIDHRAIVDLDHSPSAALGAYDGGKMNGFVSIQNTNHQPGDLAMGYYTGSAIPFSWNAAKNYVLFDQFFTAYMGDSLENHIYWVGASPGNALNGLTITGEPDGLVLNTIFDELQSAGVSWKFYIQNYQPAINFWSAAPLHNPRGENQLVWNPLLDIHRFVYNPTLASHIVNLNQYYTDLHDGTLPAVAYIIPSGDSEHPPGNIMGGQRFQRGLTTALMESSAWSSSAFEIAYDDWGGWYDSEAPPKRDAYGDGFRDAAYLISPYARRGYIDHTTLDFTSDLKFIEQNWKVPPLTQLDATAGSIMGAFDFSKPPRPPQIISLTYAVKPSPPHRVRDLIQFAGYGSAVLLVLILIGGSFRRRWPRPRLPELRSIWGPRRRHRS